MTTRAPHREALTLTEVMGISRQRGGAGLVPRASGSAAYSTEWRILSFLGVPMRDNNRRNFGYGRRMDYAVKMALLLFYGYDQQYGTVRAHYTRFVRFMKWLQQFDGTRDARHLTVDHINTYADYLSGQVSEGMFKVSYAQNLLSSLNTCLTAIRGDQRLWVSPCQKVGRRSYIRTSAADGEWEQVDKVVKVLIDDRNLCGAAVVRLARALGMRLREAALADLERIHHELKKFGYCRILEGCKGGRRCDTRTIDASPRVMEAVGFALSVKQESSRNLIHPDQSLKQFFHTAIRNGTNCYEK
jgi:hypothetical protein